MKSIFLSFVILAAQHKSFTYGFGEYFCNKTECKEGISKTASGEILSANVPSVAVPLPKNIKLEVIWIGLKTKDGICTKVRINDRTATWLIHKRGFDLSPAALKAITGKRDRHWSGKLFLCKLPKEVLKISKNMPIYKKR